MTGWSRKRPPGDQRGYNAEHRALRRRLKPIVDAGNALCARCGRPIPPAGIGPCPAFHKGVRCGKNHRTWHLDHTTDRSGYLGPAHKCCNVKAASRKANALQAAKRAREAPAPRVATRVVNLNHIGVTPPTTPPRRQVQPPREFSSDRW